MKVLKEKVLNVLLAFVMVITCVFTGWGGFLTAIGVNADASTLEAEFTNNGLFTVTSYTGVVPFEYVDGSTEGLPAGFTGAVLKCTDGGAAYINVNFSAAQIKAAFVESIIVRVYSPDYTADDEFRVNNAAGSAGGAGAHNMSTWCDIALNPTYFKDANGYLAVADIGLRDKGTISPYFYFDSITIKYKETVDVSFSGVHSVWNHYFFSDTYCTIVEFTGGIAVGNLEADYSDLVEKMTLNDQPVDATNVSFICRAWLDGQGDSIVMRWVTSPEAGSILKISAGAMFTNGSADANLYEVAEDMYMQFNGSTWAAYTPPAEPEVIPVTFSNINAMWNNYWYENTYCTFFHFNGGISGNGALDGDYSDLLSKMTVNGQPVDTNNVSFICPNWVGASGGIIMRWKTVPATGTKIVIASGASFTIGGSDVNIYETTSELTFIFNGETWAEPVKVNYTIIKCSDPYVDETLTTTVNPDGTITYTLPAYEADGKVLLGFVENRMVNETLVQTFLPVGEYTTDATGLVFTALWGGFTTMDGASIRIASAETSGIRWTTDIDAEGFNNIAYWTQGKYQFGTELSAEGFGENFDIVADTWRVENSQYTGVLIDISSKYYTTEFTARGYVDITYSNGETTRIYATANDTTRSIKGVAERAIASGDYSGTELAILQQIAGV